jgi:hypothetical protein
MPRPSMGVRGRLCGLPARCLPRAGCGHSGVSARSRRHVIVFSVSNMRQQICLGCTEQQTDGIGSTLLTSPYVCLSVRMAESRAASLSLALLCIVIGFDCRRQ